MEMKPNGNLPDSGAGARDDLMSMLRRLDREEILEALSDGVCDHCQAGLQIRISNFLNKKRSDMSPSVSSDNSPESSIEFCSAKSSNGSLESSTKSNTSWGSMKTPRSVYFGMKNVGAVNYSPASVNNKQPLSDRLGSDISEEEKKAFAHVGRKKDFVHTEKVNGKQKNVLQGLELHTRVFSAEEQKKIVECVYNLQRMGQKGQLRERTYSEPSKWMRGKGRVTIQFGCCYNYAVDKQGNPPGIIRDEEVDPLPPLFKEMIRKMLKWHVLPPTCVPNSCIVNIYEAGDCIPPHIDHHDFLRPFCTVSFLTECNILFGSNLKIVGPGEFAGPVSIPLPVGSVLILNGNGADVAKHCVPGVPAKRISITFRKMDDSKLPYRFSTDPELQGIRPIGYTPLNHSPAGPPQQNQQHENNKVSPQPFPGTSNNKSFVMEKEEFPALGDGSKIFKPTMG